MYVGGYVSGPGFQQPQTQAASRHATGTGKLVRYDVQCAQLCKLDSSQHTATGRQAGRDSSGKRACGLLKMATRRYAAQVELCSRQTLRAASNAGQKPRRMGLLLSVVAWKTGRQQSIIAFEQAVENEFKQASKTGHSSINCDACSSLQVRTSDWPQIQLESLKL